MCFFSVRIKKTNENFLIDVKRHVVTVTILNPAQKKTTKLHTRNVKKNI